jgi:hypothetical protein
MVRREAAREGEQVVVVTKAGEVAAALRAMPLL